jgi:tetratricopeptide (TPR) repeat protein
LRARYFFERWNAEGRGKALGYFQQAMAKDQEFAAAYAGLADTLTLRSYFGESTTPDERASGIAAAREAIRLDGSLAEAHASVGLALFSDLYWAEAERELQSSVSLNPNCSRCHVWYAYYMTFVQRFPDAAQEMNKAQALDPVSSMT